MFCHNECLKVRTLMFARMRDCAKRVLLDDDFCGEFAPLGSSRTLLPWILVFVGELVSSGAFMCWVLYCGFDMCIVVHVRSSCNCKCINFKRF